MKSLRKVAIAAIGIFLSQLVHAQTIDVMLVFSDEADLSTEQKVVISSAIQQSFSATYGWLDGNETVEVWPLFLPEMNFTASNKSGEQALDWMRDENANPISAFSLARTQLGNGGADVVMMVVKDMLGPACGHVYTIPLTTSRFNSESHAFAVLQTDLLSPNCPTDTVAPHELGHVLYAEHEFDTNGDQLLPSFNNHAIESESGVRSVMWSTNAARTDLLSGSISSLTGPFADNVDFISSDSFQKSVAVQAIGAAEYSKRKRRALVLRWMGCASFCLLEWESQLFRRSL